MLENSGRWEGEGAREGGRGGEREGGRGGGRVERLNGIVAG